MKRREFLTSITALGVASTIPTLAQAEVVNGGEQQDQVLTAMERYTLDLGEQVETKVFFELLLRNVREGFLADSIYGGNKDMTSWKMIGFPGARYDFRDLLPKKGQKLNIIPTSLIDNTL